MRVRYVRYVKYALDQVYLQYTLSNVKVYRGYTVFLGWCDVARAVAWRSDRGDLVIEIRGPLREEVLDALARELAWLLYTLSKEGLNWEVIDTLRRIEELLCG